MIFCARRYHNLSILIAAMTLSSFCSIPLQAKQESKSALTSEQAMRLQFYAYDQNLPLNAVIKPLDKKPTRTRYSLSFDSIHDQRVTAILAIPNNFTQPYPSVILVHGSGGDKDTSYIQWSSDALTSVGYATLSIDTQYHGDRARKGRSGEIHMPDSYTMRDAWVQSVVDIRRCVDYLQQRPDMDKHKIGYLGFSQGGMLGSVACGIEDRISCACLAVPGGGFANLVRNIDKYPVLKAHWPVKITPEILAKVDEISNITDPAHYIGMINPRPFLIFVAIHDEIIPAESSTILIEASHAREADQVKRVESGHVLNPIAIFDMRNFFVKNFGKRQRTVFIEDCISRSCFEG